MTFRALASSSEGNAYIVSDGETRILIECGITFKKLQELTEFSVSTIKACLVSHEHDDHSHCVKQLIRSGTEVYLSQGTAGALDIPEKLLNLAVEMEADKQFCIGTIDILPFEVFHDAKEPLGFLLQSRVDGDILAFATDTVNIPYNFPGVNILAVESNFQRDILDRNEKLPESRKIRIANTHMEIDKLVQCLRRMDLSRCREIYLLHLSSATSHEGQFIHKVERAVPAYIRVISCPK